MRADPYTPQSGDSGILVDHYALTLDYKVSTNRLTGTAVIRGRAASATRTLSFDLVGLRATKVTATGSRVAAFHQSDRKLRITLPAPLAAGEGFEVSVAYAGAPRPRRSRWGTIGWEELEDGALVAAQPTGAPSWFPCNDVPSDKATYRLSVTTDQAYTVVASGIRSARTTRGGKSTWVFEQNVPTPTYLMTVHVGRYVEETISLGGPVGRLFYPLPLAARVRVRLRRPAADGLALRAPVRAVPARRVRNRGRRRRPRDPARGAGSRRLRREPHRRLRRTRAPRRPRARTPVVRQQRRRVEVAGHLAQRGFRLLLGVAVVRALRRRHGAREGSRSLRAPGFAPAGSGAERPRSRPHVRRSGLQARRAHPARAAPHPRR